MSPPDVSTDRVGSTPLRSRRADLTLRPAAEFVGDEFRRPLRRPVQVTPRSPGAPLLVRSATLPAPRLANVAAEAAAAGEDRPAARR